MKLFNINIYIFYSDKYTIDLRFAYKLHTYFCKEDDIRPLILIMRVKTHTLYSSHLGTPVIVGLTLLTKW